MFLLAFQDVRLVPDGTLFIHVALILLMIWVLNRTFFRPINRVIEARRRSTGGRSTEAQEILKSLDDKQAQYEARLLKARSEGYELIERERTEAVTQRQEKIGSVRQEVAKKTARELEILTRQTAEVKSVIEQEAERMAEKISSNILK